MGGSVQEACEAINRDWAAHGPAIRAAATELTKPAATLQPTVVTTAVPAVPSTGKLSVTSVPDGADIEVDGSFVGNTPSDIQVAEGEHTVSVTKTGYKAWQRKMKVSGGSSVHLNAQLEQAAAP